MVPFDVRRSFDGGGEICDVAAAAATVNSLKGKQICGPKMCARAATARASVSDRVRGGTVADPFWRGHLSPNCSYANIGLDVY